MRHRKTGRQFSRNSSHRRAMLRGLTANLVAHERIETTDAKAKELRSVAERMITRARRLGDVAYTSYEKLSVADRAWRQAAQRQMARFLRRFAVVQDGEGNDERVDLVEKVFVDLAKRFKDRPGGYTRIVKLGRRRGDNAPMSIIEFVDGKPVDKAEAGKSKSKADAGAKKAENQKAEAKAAKPAADKKAEGAAEKATTAKADTKEAKAADAKAEKKPEAKKAESGSESKGESKASAGKAKAASSKAETASDEPKKKAAKKAPKKSE